MKTPLQWQLGLISLKDVKKYHAVQLVTISNALQTIGIIATHWDNHTLDDERVIRVRLSQIISESDFLGLNCTKKSAQRFLDSIDAKIKQGSDALIDALNELQTRFDDEIEEINFFYVNPDRLKWFDHPEHAGEQFKANFPIANSELIEAGNCFALDRYTACVFHLTRALEIVLSSLHRALKIPEETDPRNNTWGRKLGRISDKIAEYDKNPPANWSNDAVFYKKVFALLAAVKTALRDDTVHIATIYDETGAGCVLLAMVGALNQVATKLAE